MESITDNDGSNKLEEDFLPMSLLTMAVATVLALGTDSLVKQIWAKGHPDISREGFQFQFRSTFLFGAAHSITISARVYMCFVLMDVGLQYARSSALPQVLEAIFPTVSSHVNFSQAAPYVAGYLWVGLSACTIKRVLLLQSVSGKRLGRVALFDHFLDFLIMGLTMINILDTLTIDLSTGIQSILSMGGVGALVFSLASKNLAENVVGGFALNAWDAFDVGDIILLGDGTEGTVKEVGLIETLIKGYDNIVTRIPNGQLTARVSNLSRVKRSRCYQSLRFKYKDLAKLEQVLEDIKLEIQKACPTVITDGSAGFHAVLEEYKADHISALVITNFEIKPRTKDYFDNRQQFVLAISRAMQKHNVDFAIPSIEYNTIPSSKIQG